MDLSAWPDTSFSWANVYALLGPRVNVQGRMALVLLIAVAWAFVWLLWRAYSVIQTPNELLVEKLGLDIPSPPSLTLEEIGAREVQVSWKSNDTTGSIQDYHVEVNGKTVGVTRKHENVAQIYNLRPGTLYDVRIFSTSTGRFQTPSAVLRIRTIALRDGLQQLERSEDAIAIRTLTPRLPPAPSTVPASTTGKEQTGSSISRRGTLARRASPAGQENILNEATQRGEDESDGNLPELSLQLQNLEREIQSLEAQLLDDEKDHENALKDRESERDELKQRLRERDEASSELRRQVHKAEAANRTAQHEKRKKEAVLEQARNHRQQRKNEMTKWDKQMAIMDDEVRNLKEQTTLTERKKQSEIDELREKIKEEESLLKALEAENKEKHQEIKALEEERKQLDYEDETDETRETERQEQEKARSWRDRMTILQNQYNKLAYDLQNYHHQAALIQDRLETSRRAVTYAYPMLMQPEPETFRRGLNGMRSNRHASSHGSTVSSPRTAFGSIEPYNMNAHFSTTLNTSPNTVGLSFFNTANGMTLVPTDPAHDLMEEPEFMTGAPMSPRADALLPADLLGDESNDEFDEVEQSSPKHSMSGGNLMDGPGKEDDGSKSPDTASTPRSFASPIEEPANKAQWQDRTSSSSPKGQARFVDDVDEKQDSPYAKKPSAMASLFHFNRQRGKTLADQPPLLGSLKAGQSQSFPRNFDEFDPSAQPRRRMSYGNSRHFPGSSLLSRGQSVRDPERISATRRAFPGLFGKSSAASQSYDPFDPDSMRNDAASSRPASVYSFDKMPRVSMDAQFRAWGLVEKAPRHYSPLAPEWSVSRNHSRRPSIGYGSTSNLSLVPDPEEDYVPPRREPLRPLQAPIGTRPASSQRPATPKLNPAAPSFTSFFGKSKEKAKEKAKVKEEEKRKASEAENTSPPGSRKSRDTNSIAATASTYESRDSLERTPSGYSGSAITPVGENPVKPTFISKITRKASSNKFGSWKGQGGIFSRNNAGTPVGTPTGAETEDEAMNTLFENFGKPYESMSSTPVDDKDKKASRNSLSSWNFMRKKPKGERDKKDDPTASEVSESIGSERASRASIEVTTEEEDDVDPREIPLH